MRDAIDIGARWEQALTAPKHLKAMPQCVAAEIVVKRARFDKRKSSGEGPL